MLVLLFVFIMLFWGIKHNIKTTTSSPYILAPDNMVLLLFALSCMVASFNYNRWGDISVLTFFVVILALLSFVLGASFAKSKTKTKVSGYKTPLPLIIPRYVTVCVIIMMAIVTYLQYKDTLTLVGSRGLGIIALSLATRESIYMEDLSIDHSALVWQGLYASKAVVYIYLLVILHQKIYFKKSIWDIKIIPIIIYIVQILLSTGRSEFIYLTYAILFYLYYFKKQKNKWSLNDDKFFFKYGIIGLAGFMAVFLYIANLRNEGSVDVTRTISEYVGSPIYAYDNYLNENGIMATSSYFGEYTMLFLYSIGRALKLTTLAGVDTLPPVSLPGAETNIYTCLFRYTHDYGIIIMLVIVFFIGYFYSKIFKKIKSSVMNYKMIALYTFLSYPLVEFTIEERFMTTLISARTIFLCLYIYYLFDIIVKTGDKRYVSL